MVGFVYDTKAIVPPCHTRDWLDGIDHPRLAQQCIAQQ
jgi:hypothetical protein